MVTLQFPLWVLPVLWLILFATAIAAAVLSWDESVHSSWPSLALALVSLAVVVAMMIASDWPTLFGYGLPQDGISAPPEGAGRVVTAWMAAMVLNLASIFSGLWSAYRIILPELIHELRRRLPFGGRDSDASHE